MSVRILFQPQQRQKHSLRFQRRILISQGRFRFIQISYPRDIRVWKIEKIISAVIHLSEPFNFRLILPPPPRDVCYKIFKKLLTTVCLLKLKMHFSWDLCTALTENKIRLSSSDGRFLPEQTGFSFAALSAKRAMASRCQTLDWLILEKNFWPKSRRLENGTHTPHNTTASVKHFMLIWNPKKIV